MTTEAKLKKFEEDLLLLEDQNTKLSKVSGRRVPGSVASKSPRSVTGENPGSVAGEPPGAGGADTRVGAWVHPASAPTSSASRGFVTLSVAVFPLPPFVTLSLKEAITE